MKNIGIFLSENFQFLEMKFSIYLDRRVFVMIRKVCYNCECPRTQIYALSNAASDIERVRKYFH